MNIPIQVPASPMQSMGQIMQPMLDEYMPIAGSPLEAGRLAAIDRIWLQVAKEYKILTGDKKLDKFLWEDHQLFMQGATEEDPIMRNTDARDEFLKRVMKMFGGEDAIGSRI